jgi:hypothetical protein
MGSAAAVRERIGSPRLAAEQEEQDAILSRIRAGLGVERAETLRVEGGAAGLEPTVREALAWLAPGSRVEGTSPV